MYWIRSMSPRGYICETLVLPHENLNRQAASLVRDNHKIARVEDLEGKEHTRKVFHYLVREEQMNL